MPVTTKWGHRRRAGARARRATAPLPSPSLKRARTDVPRRGYHKGVSDAKEPLPHFVRTRLSEKDFEGFRDEACIRATGHSDLVRAILVAHLNNQRPELARPRGPGDELVRELRRIGNNLNQLARQANTGLVAVRPRRSRAASGACMEQRNSDSGPATPLQR